MLLEYEAYSISVTDAGNEKFHDVACVCFAAAIHSNSKVLQIFLSGSGCGIIALAAVPHHAPYGLEHPGSIGTCRCDIATGLCTRMPAASMDIALDPTGRVSLRRTTVIR